MTLTNRLWVLIFITFPLLGFELFRLNFGPFEIPIFIVLLFMGMLGHYIRICVGQSTLAVRLSMKQKLFLIAFYLFIILHIFNTFDSLAIERAISQQVKLFAAFLTFITISMSFPKDRLVIRKSIEIIIFSSTILLLIYIYRYLFIFDSPFLSIDWDMSGRHGRNQLGLYLAAITPLALWRYLHSRVFSVWIIPFVTHMFAVFYTLSRGTWVALFLSLPLILILLLGMQAGEQMKRFFRIFAGGVGIVVLVLFFYFSESLPLKEDFENRVQSLLTMEDSEGQRSISSRKTLVYEGLDLFSENPVLGSGTSSFVAIKYEASHNDYVAILSEQGIIGIVVFLFLIFLVIQNVCDLSDKTWEAVGLKHGSIAIIFYMNFVNAYKVSMIYVIFGLLFSLNNINRLRRKGLDLNDGIQTKNFACGASLF